MENGVNSIVINNLDFTSLLTLDNHAPNVETTKFIVDSINSQNFLLLNLESNEHSGNDNETFNISICEDDNQTNVFSLDIIPNSTTQTYKLGFLPPGEYCINTSTDADQPLEKGVDIQVTITTVNTDDIINVNNNIPVSILTNNIIEEKYFNISSTNTYYFNFLTNGWEINFLKSIKIFDNKNNIILDINIDELALSPELVLEQLETGGYGIVFEPIDNYVHDNNNSILLTISDSDNIPVDFSINKNFNKNTITYELLTNSEIIFKETNYNTENGFIIEGGSNTKDIVMLEYTVLEKYLLKYNSWKININLNVNDSESAFGEEKLYFFKTGGSDSHITGKIIEGNNDFILIENLQTGEQISTVNITSIMQELAQSINESNPDREYEIKIVLYMESSAGIIANNSNNNLLLIGDNQGIYNLEHYNQLWTDSNLRTLNVFSYDNSVELSSQLDIIQNLNYYQFPDNYIFDNNYKNSIINIVQQNEKENVALHLIVYKNTGYDLYNITNGSIDLSPDNNNFDINTTMDNDNNQYYILVSNTETTTLPDTDTNNDTPVLNPTLPESDICLPAGMPIQTDQGIVEIQNITTKNTIRGLRVLRLVECFNKDTHLISIRRSAFSQGYPKSTVLVSENHGIYTEPQSNVFNRARGLVNNVDVRKVHVGRHKIYNILLEKHSYMYVNGLKVETMSNEHAKKINF